MCECHVTAAVRAVDGDGGWREGGRELMGGGCAGAEGRGWLGNVGLALGTRARYLLD